MALAGLMVFAVWPVLGVVVLQVVNAHMRRRHGRAPIPRAWDGADVLARMYLWPAVLYRYLRRR